MSNVKKIDLLRQAYAAGDKIGALRIAAKFPQLGSEKAVITRAWAAHTNPAFYAQMGKDPAALISAGLAAMADKYKLA